MARLTIVRGLPGSGKTTFAKTLGCAHFEADMYHIKDGLYEWKASNLRYAHQWCQDMVWDCSNHKIDCVVSNTFTTLKEMRPYLDMKFDTIKVYHCTGDYGNIHDVPDDIIEKMRNRWYKHEGEIYV